MLSTVFQLPIQVGFLSGSFQVLFNKIEFSVQLRDTTNSTEKICGIYTVVCKYRRKRPNTVGRDRIL
jgi:hypothetical protein